MEFAFDRGSLFVKVSPSLIHISGGGSDRKYNGCTVVEAMESYADEYFPEDEYCLLQPGDTVSWTYLDDDKCNHRGVIRHVSHLHHGIWSIEFEDGFDGEFCSDELELISVRSQD